MSILVQLVCFDDFVLRGLYLIDAYFSWKSVQLQSCGGLKYIDTNPIFMNFRQKAYEIWLWETGPNVKKTLSGN